jgi:hypothetical protein
LTQPSSHRAGSDRPRCPAHSRPTPSIGPRRPNHAWCGRLYTPSLNCYPSGSAASRPRRMLRITVARQVREPPQDRIAASSTTHHRRPSRAIPHGQRDRPATAPLRSTPAGHLSDHTGTLIGTARNEITAKELQRQPHSLHAVAATFEKTATTKGFVPTLRRRQCLGNASTTQPKAHKTPSAATAETHQSGLEITADLRARSWPAGVTQRDVVRRRNP